MEALREDYYYFSSVMNSVVYSIWVFKSSTYAI